MKGELVCVLRCILSLKKDKEGVEIITRCKWALPQKGKGGSLAVSETENDIITPSRRTGLRKPKQRTRGVAKPKKAKKVRPPGRKQNVTSDLGAQTPPEGRST